MVLLNIVSATAGDKIEGAYSVISTGATKVAELAIGVAAIGTSKVADGVEYLVDRLNTDPKGFVVPRRIWNEQVKDLMDPRSGTGVEDNGVLVYITDKYLREIASALIDGRRFELRIEFIDGQDLPWKLAYIERKAEKEIAQAVADNPAFPSDDSDDDYTHKVDVLATLTHDKEEASKTVYVTLDIAPLEVATS